MAGVVAETCLPASTRTLLTPGVPMTSPLTPPGFRSGSSISREVDGLRYRRAVSVLLRALEQSDLDMLDGADAPFLDFGPRAPRTKVPAAGLDDSGALAVVEDEGGGLAGFVSWHWQQWGPNAASRCPNIGIWIRACARGRGVGQQAQRQLAELFFRHTAVNRVEAHTDIENVAEQRALVAAGFHREGLIRGAQWRDGAYRDGYLYAITRSDVQAN
ncbi:MAG: GNAT family protein [Actinomycetota bacterium]|nr:GNAT family protein [Actinomycetota bacterium]